MSKEVSGSFSEVRKTIDTLYGVRRDQTGEQLHRRGTLYPLDLVGERRVLLEERNTPPNFSLSNDGTESRADRENAGQLVAQRKVAEDVDENLVRKLAEVGRSNRDEHVAKTFFGQQFLFFDDGDEEFVDDGAGQHRDDTRQSRLGSWRRNFCRDFGLGRFQKKSLPFLQHVLFGPHGLLARLQRLRVFQRLRKSLGRDGGHKEVQGCLNRAARRRRREFGRGGSDLVLIVRVDFGRVGVHFGLGLWGSVLEL